MNTAFIHKKLESYKAIVRSSKELERIMKTRISNINYEKASLDERIEREVADLIRDDKIKLKECERELENSIKDIKLKAKEKIEHLFNTVKNSVKDEYVEKRNSFILLKSSIEDLSPLAILKRGYSIMTDEKGKIIKHIKSVKPGKAYTIRLSDGKATVKAEDKSEL